MLEWLRYNADYLTLGVVLLCGMVLAHMILSRVTQRLRGLSATGVVLALLLVPGWWIVDAAESYERSNIKRMLSGFAPTYAMELAGEGHARITVETPPDDPTYLRLIEMEKSWLALNPTVADIYTMRLQNGRPVLIVDSETDYDHNGVYEGDRESRTRIGEVYTEFTPAMRAAFGGSPTFETDPIRDRWGKWFSAFTPMYDASGRVEAILGVDYPAADLLSAITRSRTITITSIGAFVIVVIASVSTIALLRARLLERRQQARRLDEARRAAEAASNAKSFFLANMSHELRTPLTAILGFADVLHESQIGATERQNAVDTIRRNGEHLLGLINDILDMSKIEAGQLTVERTRTAIVDVVGGVTAITASRAAERGLYLRVEFVDRVPEFIETDPTRLRQILLNLVTNAIKFTDKGGVTLRVSYAAAGQISQSPAPGDPITFDVIDSGLGISPAGADRLFKPFSQADSTMARRHGGTGLGLTISRDLAHILGGDVTLVRSDPGIGSQFRATVQVGYVAGNRLISAADAHNALQREPSKPESAAEIRVAARVLLAEDGADNQRIITMILRRAGAHVDVVENGLLAVEAAHAAVAAGTPYDVILMDLQMPGLDGAGAVQQLRAAQYRGVIIALTAHALTSERVRCEAAGFDDYETKPINRRRLLEMIARYTQRRQPMLAN